MKHTLASLAALLALSAASQAANQVTISPDTTSLRPGETVVLHIAGAGFDALTLGGGLSLRWNPDVLDLDSLVVDASQWEFARHGGLLDAAGGTLSDLYFASFNGRMGSFGIATLRFVADRPGHTDLAMTGSPDFPFSDVLAEVMPVQYRGAAITVTAVPEPAAAMLLLGGLAGLAWRSSRTASGPPWRTVCQPSRRCACAMPGRATTRCIRRTTTR